MANDHSIPPAVPPRESSRRRFPSWPVSIWLVICLGVAVASFLPVIPDRAIGNLMLLVGVGLAYLSFAAWFVFRSGYSRTARRRAGWFNLVLFAGAALFRPDGNDGELRFKFVPRWKPRHYQTVDRREVAPSLGEEPDADQEKIPDYAGFLGSQRNATLTGIPLERNWSEHPPRVMWRQPIGDGWSAFAVKDGHAVTMEQQNGNEVTFCLDVRTGKTLWTVEHPALHQTTVGGAGPRSTPTLVGDHCYCVGATGFVQCIELNSGKVVWSFDVYQHFGMTQDEEEKSVFWGRAGSPLVLEHLVIVPGGGTEAHCASLLALDRESGQVVWEGGKHQVGYASPSEVELCGKRQIMIVNEACVTGHDPETGAELWSFDWPGTSNAAANSSQAVAVGNDRVFVSKAYGGGAALFQVAHGNDNQWTVEPIYQKKQLMKTKFTNVVIRDGYVYGLSDGTLECLRLEDGERQWHAGRYRQGQIMLVDDLILVQAESGEVALVEASPKGHHELSIFPAIEGITWNNPALAGKYLLVRNGVEAACYELPLVSKGSAGETAERQPPREPIGVKNL